MKGMIVVLCLMASTAFGQLSDSVMHVVEQIKELNRFHSAVLPKQTKHPQLSNAHALNRFASDQELLYLTEHGNGVIRAYAITLLDQREVNVPFSVITDHFMDKEKIEVIIHGAEYIKGWTGKRMVGEYFMDYSHLTDAQVKSRDSMLIHIDNEFNATESLLHDLKPNPVFHERLRYLCKKGRFQSSPLALARFRDEEDLPILEHALNKDPYHAMELIQEFPHPHFKAFLEQYGKQKNVLGFLYYPALCVYQDSFALSLLLNEVKDRGDDSYSNKKAREYMLDAVNKFPHPIFDPLRIELWKRGTIDRQAFRSLVSRESNRIQCLDLINSTLSEPKYGYEVRQALDTLISYICDHDSKRARRLILQVLPHANVHVSGYYAEHAARFKDQEMMDVLFAKLDGESNAHMYLPVIKTLLDFNDPEVNTRLLGVLSESDQISDWGKERTIAYLSQKGLRVEGWD